MKKYIQLNMKNEAGMSLAEVLASIVILSILLFIFLGMFVQSSKVNVKSEEVIDATYQAQTHIENLYALSSVTELAEREIEIEGLGYDPPSTSDPNWLVFEKNSTDYEITLKLEKNIIEDPTDADYNAMTSAVIEVNTTASAVGSKATGKMELLLQWKVDEPTP